MERVVSIAFSVSLVATLFVAVYAEDPPEVIYDKQITLAEDMASIAYENQNDCDLMGMKLGKLVVANAAFMKKVQKLTPEERRRGEHKHQVRGRASRIRMLDGLVKCHANARVKAAMEKVQALEASAADTPVFLQPRGNNTAENVRTSRSQYRVHAEVIRRPDAVVAVIAYHLAALDEPGAVGQPGVADEDVVEPAIRQQPWAREVIAARPGRPRATTAGERPRIDKVRARAVE